MHYMLLFDEDNEEMVERQYRATGQLFEKYQVETGQPGSGGEYRVATSFG